MRLGFKQSKHDLRTSVVDKRLGVYVSKVSKITTAILNNICIECSHLNRIKLRFKSSEHINEKGDGPYCGFGYLSLFSDPIGLTTWSHRE